MPRGLGGGMRSRAATVAGSGAGLFAAGSAISDQVAGRPVAVLPIAVGGVVALVALVPPVLSGLVAVLVKFQVALMLRAVRRRFDTVVDDVAELSALLGQAAQLVSMSKQLSRDMAGEPEDAAGANAEDAVHPSRV